MNLVAAALLLAASCLADNSVSHPQIDYSSLGGQIAVLGDFDSLSFYSYANASSFLTPSSDAQSLYLRNTTSGESDKIASVTGGHVRLLQQLGSDSVLVGGDFSAFNNAALTPPLIYNVTSREAELIFSSLSKRDGEFSGRVATTLIDGDLIYLGGDFEYNSTFGAAVYSISTKSISSLPFGGFGSNASVNSIVKYAADSSAGSVIFGGSFDTLGVPELLMHNVSRVESVANLTNSTNTSLVSAEQLVSLKHATFTTINAASDGSGLICPSLSVWALDASSGGQWLATLPLEMRGVYPTKVRLYPPSGSSNGVQSFRIYSYPNNGIMNLTYVDPETNTLAYCDAACPLLLASTLEESTDNNLSDRDEINDPEEGVFINSDGSYAVYYDAASTTKNLGYGSNYQEFAFVNNVAVDLVGITVVEWYGDNAELAGFELYLDSISVYGNDTLNDSNCDVESADELNSAEIVSGSWQSVQDLSSAVSDTSYMVAVVDSSAEIVMYPNISYSGDYSVLLYTPGCADDGSCERRSIVNVTFTDVNDTVLSSSLIYQNNDDEKFDYLYYGHLDGSSETGGHNKISVSFHSAVDLSVTDPWMVVDKVVANIVSLDDYYATNTTNSTTDHNTTKYSIENIYLNGLFEYSLANFSDFSEDLVFSSSGNDIKIESTNTFVGNSTLNELSGKLDSNSNITQLLIQNSSDTTNLLVLGTFSSSNVSLLNDNMITLKLDGYNVTSNSTDAILQARRLQKRDVQISGLKFNDSVAALYDVEGGYVAMGDFSATGTIKDLSNRNESVSALYNFALNLDGDWYSLGNEYFNSLFSGFTSFELEDHEIWIFSSGGSDYKVWDNTDYEWSANSDLKVSTSLSLKERDQQILGGTSFGSMDYDGVNQAYFTNDSEFSSLGFNFTEGAVASSFYVNDSYSVIGGKFEANLTLVNLAVINMNQGQKIGDFDWDDNASVSSLHVDTNSDFLFIASNGSVSFDSTTVSGVVVFDLKNGTAASVQPASLSADDDSELNVNVMAYYDSSDVLLVGGNFAEAGSLDCAAVCLYDIPNTRWYNPATNDDSPTIGGAVYAAKFFNSDQVLLAGNITLGGNSTDFAIYNFKTGSFEVASTSLSSTGISDSFVENFIINDNVNGQLNIRMVAYGLGFVSGFNGSGWSNIDSEIDYSDETKFTDLKLVQLKKSISTNSDQRYFDNDKALILTGTFNITNYGIVNAALFDGTSWIPFIFSQGRTSGIGSVNTLLFEDIYRLLSSSDVTDKNKKLSAGKVIGVSLACAIGSTLLLGVLYFVPLLFLFKDSKRDNSFDQRIYEDEMIHAVKPEELFHEIDLHRNTYDH